MPLAQLVGPELPYLRRFARALTGDQRNGDEYVAATIEAILADPDRFDYALPPRVALYQAFLRLWEFRGQQDIAVVSPTSPIEWSAVHNLNALMPFPRVVYLLRAVEELSIREIAVTVDRSVEEIGVLLNDARCEIMHQIETDILIIEDEPVIAMDLEALAQDLGHHVIGIARTHAEAIDLIAIDRPGLVMADLQLADGSSGLDATNEILADLSVPVIFITAYPEQLLTGTTAEPTFLIAKPFRTTTVKATISQALFFGQNALPLPIRQRAI